MGTFSKVIAPSLRLGYVVVPDPLLDAMLAAKSLAVSRTPLYEQAVLSDFIADGHFLRHVRRMRILYDERRAAFERLVREEIGAEGQLRAIPAGMHGMFDSGSRARRRRHRRALSRCRRDRPGPVLLRHAPGPPALLLGFAAVPPKEQRRALQVVARAIRSSRAGDRAAVALGSGSRAFQP